MTFIDLIIITVFAVRPKLIDRGTSGIKERAADCLQWPWIMHIIQLITNVNKRRWKLDRRRPRIDRRLRRSGQDIFG